MEKDFKKLNQSFEVNSVCRADLFDKLGEEKASKLTDEEMENIAVKMGDILCDIGYWDALDAAVDYVMDK